jgi:hypothetical protein
MKNSETYSAFKNDPIEQGNANQVDRQILQGRFGSIPDNKENIVLLFNGYTPGKLIKKGQND